MESQSTARAIGLVLVERTAGCGEGLRLARNALLDELPIAAFAAITLVWVIASFAGLVWRELPAGSLAHGQAVAHAFLTSPSITILTRTGSIAGLISRGYGFFAAGR